VSAQYFIAKVTQLDQYVLLVAGKVVSTQATAAEAVKARDALLKPRG
jgi:hypothetical protein